MHLKIFKVFFFLVVPHIKVPDLILCFSEGNFHSLPLQSLLHTLGSTRIQELQVCQESCDQSTKCASERQLYKPQKTITDFPPRFLQGQGTSREQLLIHLDTGQNTSSVLMFTLDTVTAGFLQQDTE